MDGRLEELTEKDMNGHMSFRDFDLPRVTDGLSHGRTDAYFKI